MFDPVDKSWEAVMELNQESVWGYRAEVVQGKIYVLQTQPREQYSATTNFKYVLYELDIASKAWTRKGTPVFYTLEKGAMEPVMFDYKGHLYIYGGESSIGYFGGGTTDMYKYTPETNLWTMLFLSPNNDLGCKEHFGYVLNGKVYFGLGLTDNYEWSSDIWELDLE